jgi:predicted urease superfamily metal-dependent hydrolase
MGKPIFVDTHCHLDSHYFPEGAHAVIARARAAGVGGFVVIGVGEKMQGARDAVALATEVGSSLVATAGVHPHDASVVDDEVRAELEALAAHERVVAVGETGLDYHYDHSPRDVQRRAFAEQIALAKRVRKPIVLHTREAAADTLEVLEAEGARDVGGVVHCFSEDRAFAERAAAGPTSAPAPGRTADKSSGKAIRSCCFNLRQKRSAHRSLLLTCVRGLMPPPRWRPMRIPSCIPCGDRAENSRTKRKRGTGSS